MSDKEAKLHVKWGDLAEKDPAAFKRMSERFKKAKNASFLKYLASRQTGLSATQAGQGKKVDAKTKAEKKAENARIAAISASGSEGGGVKKTNTVKDTETAGSGVIFNDKMKAEYAKQHGLALPSDVKKDPRAAAIDRIRQVVQKVQQRNMKNVQKSFGSVEVPSEAPHSAEIDDIVNAHRDIHSIDEADLGKDFAEKSARHERLLQLAQKLGDKQMFDKHAAALRALYGKNNVLDSTPAGTFKQKVDEAGIKGGIGDVDYMRSWSKDTAPQNCSTCHGRKYLYVTPQGEAFADRTTADSTQVKCPDCAGKGWVKEEVEQLDEKYNKDSLAHKEARRAAGDMRSYIKPMYHADGSATLLVHGDKDLSSTEVVDSHYKDNDLGYNRSEEDYKRFSRTKDGLKHTTKQTGPNSHEIHITATAVREEVEQIEEGEWSKFANAGKKTWSDEADELKKQLINKITANALKKSYNRNPNDTSVRRVLDINKKLLKKEEVEQVDESSPQADESKLRKNFYAQHTGKVATWDNPELLKAAKAKNPKDNLSKIYKRIGRGILKSGTVNEEVEENYPLPPEFDQAEYDRRQKEEKKAKRDKAKLAKSQYEKHDISHSPEGDGRFTILHKGRPVVTAVDLRDVNYYKQQVLKSLRESTFDFEESNEYLNNKKLAIRESIKNKLASRMGKK